MLKSYITASANTKFILITDSFEHRDPRLFDYILKPHLERKSQVLYCTFEGVYNKTKSRYESYKNVAVENFVCSPSLGGCSIEDFENIAERELNLLVIDSLAIAVIRYSLSSTFRILNSFLNSTEVKQIVAVLHKDLLEDHSPALLYFTNLCSLHIDFQPEFLGGLPRFKYQYNKSRGRTIAEIEEYYFEDGQLITKQLQAPDPVKVLEKIENKDPENLSTFKIGLTDEEKLSKDKVILPYLPSADEGQIIYELDEHDDWDEEDPDDDLDI